MDISFKDRKLKETLEDPKQRTRTYGAKMAKKLMRRLMALRAAVSLVDFWPALSGSERCHELKANLAGMFSMDLEHPYRLLFKPLGIGEKSEYSSERDRWAAIQAIEILGIEDTHV